MTIPTRTDVLIVGAGPTGLMLANQLVRRGVRPLIIDRNTGPSVHSKALGVQARTLEIYSKLGIAERAIELGTRAAGANIWVDGRKAARLPLGDIGRELSPYPFLLILGQDDNERLLGELLTDRGLGVQWNTELVHLVQNANDVRATLKLPDGTTLEIVAKWVAGCDGSRSAVRSLNTIEFVGAPYQHVFFVADTMATGPMVADELNVMIWKGGFHLFFPMRSADHWRVVGIVPPDLRERDDVDFDDVLPSILHEAGPTLSFTSCNWFSTYRIHHRRAARFRAQRCFLLGDAAHIHSPVGAQGMNTGLQDAYNLAWKLALVNSGKADEELLESYELERVPVAERLLKTTDQAFAIVVSERWLAKVFRTRVFSKIVAFAMTVDRIRKLAFRTISQIGINYPGSPLSEMSPGYPQGAPQAGERFPWIKLSFSPNGPVEDVFSRLDDTKFNLVVIGQPSPAEGATEFDSLIVSHCVADDAVNEQELNRVGIPNPSFYLLRPDGHIGIAGTRLEIESLKRYLTDRLGLSS
jgi:2-polyprenyl-6-methoxyphenol hydroxylase-like FAD-dependent oxidoreductase